MIAVVQRVSEASVIIDNEVYNKINKGFLVLLGIKQGDSEAVTKTLARKVIDLRIFPDENDKMNLSLKNVDGEALIISQFTLCTDNEKSGNRPSFVFAEEPARASALYDKFVEEMKEYYNSDKIFGGVFAAYMKIKLENDGPVTIILEKTK
jgi:D-tyrosyl-tRNA(Tyr) deacylase